MRLKGRIQKWKIGFSLRFGKMMKCMRSGEQLRVDDDMAVSSSESLATKDYSASGYSSRAAELDSKLDNSNIEEAESSLRESGYLNYEEARALLGRLEYQKGNIEGALHVFEGIDITAVTSRMKVSLSKKLEQNRRRSQSDPSPTMSMHAISLLLEALLLKAKSLQGLGRFSEAANSCKIIMDTVESALPDGISEQVSSDNKLQEILNKAVELLPELCKLAGSPEEAIVAYRRALLYYWNLDTETTARIQKEFAMFLLYSGTDAIPPTLRFQMEGSFVPRNNIEEAVLLLLILLRKFALRKIGWDPSVMDHLSFALSVSGELRSLAYQVEELLPGTIDRQVRFCTLSLCYHGDGDDEVALNLLRNFLKDRENKRCTMELLLASKICAGNSLCVDEGITYACKALCEPGRCVQIASVTNCLLGLLLSNKSRSVASDSERFLKQSETIEKLELAERMMKQKDPNIIYYLSLENAEQRKLDAALCYAKQVFKLEAGSSIKSYVLLARILSAQKRFIDAETVINAALDQTGRWDHGELLRTKAKLQVAQGHLKSSIETYTHLLAILQVRSKNSGMEKKLLYKSSRNHDRKLEMETWHDLANVYTSMSQWRDAEVCLSKSMAINPYSASRWHSTGVLYEAKGMQQEALKAYKAALDVEPNHVPSLISTACVLKRVGVNSLPVIKSFLTDALRLDKLNHCAWHQLGLIYKADDSSSALDAMECFEAAAMLEETAPIEPFR
ncbi:Protein NPGR2 [Linum grandiflorum]